MMGRPETERVRIVAGGEAPDHPRRDAGSGGWVHGESRSDSPGRDIAVPKRRGHASKGAGVVVGLVATLVMLGGGFLGPAGSVDAQSIGEVSWDRLDVTIDVEDDGQFAVTERQVIQFVDGPFRTAFAELPLDRAESIENVRVSEDRDGETIAYEQVNSSRLSRDRAEEFAVSVTNGNVLVEWTYPPTSDDTRSFVLEYDVTGSLRSYPGEDPANQQVWWVAVSEEVTAVGPVREASLTVSLPEAVPLDQVVIGPGESVAPADYTEDGRTFTWTARDLGAGNSFEGRIQVPPVVAGYDPPAWQRADDERRASEAEREERGAVLNLGFIGLGLLLSVGGGLGIFGWWYVRGRDPHSGLVADYLPEPPSSLSPGAAGTLLDEEADEEDIVATVVDLGHRGVISITEEAPKGSVFGASRDFLLTLRTPDAEMRPLERTLVATLFGAGAAAGAVTEMSEAKAAFDATKPAIRADLYAELVEAGLFPRSPEETRAAWRRGAGIVLVVAVAIGLVSIGAFGGIAPFVWFPVIVFGGLALVLRRLAGAMPRKTAAGAEEKAKWAAFRRYLSSIERYEDLNEAKETFDRYLPYAVAFGLDREWTAKFAQVDTPMPAWFDTGGAFPDILIDPMAGSGRARRGGYRGGRGGGWVIGGSPFGGGAWGGSAGRDSGGGGGRGFG